MEEFVLNNKSDALPKKCYCSTVEEQRSDRSHPSCSVVSTQRSTFRSPTPALHLVPRNAKIKTDDLREVAHFLRNTGPIESVDCQSESDHTAPSRKEKTSKLGLRRRPRPKVLSAQRNKPLVGFVACGPTLVPRVSSSGVHYIEIASPHSRHVTFRCPSTDLSKIRCDRNSTTESAQLSSQMKVETMAAPVTGETLPQMAFSGYDSVLADEAINTYISSLQLPNYGDYANKEPYLAYQTKKKPSPADDSHPLPYAKPQVSKNDPQTADFRFGFEQNCGTGKLDWRGENSDKPLPSLPDSTCQSPTGHIPSRSSYNSPSIESNPFAANINQRSLNTLSTFISQDGLKSAHLRLNATLANQHSMMVPVGTCNIDDRHLRNGNKIQPAPRPAPAIQQSFAARRANARARKLRDLERLRESIDDIRQMPNELHSPSVESEDPFAATPKPIVVRPSKTTNNIGSSPHPSAKPGLKKTRESVSMPSIEKLDLSPMPLMNERFPAPATTKPTFRKSTYRLTTTAPATPPPSRPVPPLPDEARELYHSSTTASNTSSGTLRSAPSTSQKSPGTDHRSSLEDRLQHTERENRLLEAALMAMLRTNGLLNGCACCSSSCHAASQTQTRFSTSSSTATNTFSSSMHTRQVSEDDTGTTAVEKVNGDINIKSRGSQDTSASSVSSARTGCSSKALDAYLRTRVDFTRTPTPPAIRPGSSSFTTTTTEEDEPTDEVAVVGTDTHIDAVENKDN